MLMPLVGLCTQFTIGGLCPSAVEYARKGSRKASDRMREFVRARYILVYCLRKFLWDIEIPDLFEITQNYLRFVGSFNVITVFGQRESHDCPHCSQASHGIGTKTGNDLHRSSMNHLGDVRVTGYRAQFHTTSTATLKSFKSRLSLLLQRARSQSEISNTSEPAGIVRSHTPASDRQATAR